MLRNKNNYVLILEKMLWLFGLFLRPFSSKILANGIYAFIYAAAISRKKEKSITLLLNLETLLYNLTGKEATRYNKGIHPKHRLINYHQFFFNRVTARERILDIGCGNGYLAFELAQKTGAEITAIDILEKNIAMANERFAHKKIKYICGDAITNLPNGFYDVIVLSNVLEHIEDRVEFLSTIQKKTFAKRWLFRVPMYSRDWRVPLMEEIGIDYRLDSSHFIEYTVDSFKHELNDAGLEAIEIEIGWGEIWCEAKVIGKKK